MGRDLNRFLLVVVGILSILCFIAMNHLGSTKLWVGDLDLGSLTRLPL